MAILAPYQSLAGTSNITAWQLDGSSSSPLTGLGSKRKAEASASHRSTRRRGQIILPPPKLAVANVETSSTSREPSFYDAIPRLPIPEPLSINNLLRQSCRSRLYVTPLQWTFDQLQLLDCHFAPQRSRQGKRMNRSKLEYQLPSLMDTMTDCEEVIRTAANQLLSQAHNAVAKHGIVEELLSIYGIRRVGSGDLPFHFGQRTVAILKTGGIFTNPTSSITPSLAYLDLDSMSTLRDNSIQITECNRINPPVARRRQKQLRRLQPRIEAEDPYIAAVLIALAQEQRKASRIRETQTTAEATGETDTDVTPLQSSIVAAPPLKALTDARDGRHEEAASSFEVNLLATPAIDTRRLYFFTARFPAEFLDKLDMPSRFSPSNPLVISYSCLKLKLVSSLTRELDMLLRARPRRLE